MFMKKIEWLQIGGKIAEMRRSRDMTQQQLAELTGLSDVYIRYNAENLEAHPDSVLTGKRILFLGSSVTYGVAAQGQSFVELFETLDGVKAIKEAKSGTTLVDKNSILALIAFGNGDSYECAFYQKQ